MDAFWSDKHNTRAQEGHGRAILLWLAPRQWASAAHRQFHAERARWFLWLPVLLAAGSALYFSLPVEPPVWAVGCLAMTAGFFLLGMAKGSVSPVVAAGLAAIIAGVCVGKARTLTAGPGVVILPIGVVEVQGWIERVEARAEKRGIRFYIVPTQIGLRKLNEPLPRKISVVWRGPLKNALRPGDHVVMRARFLAPPGPIWPGGHDPRFFRWFNGIGASGFSLRAPEKTATTHTRPFRLVWSASVEEARLAIAGRIRAALPEASGAVAVALLTGDRAGIPDNVRDHLRAAGLAHLLAISGLHMALFAGGVFWLVRAAFAINPVLALRWPIKKWAAGGALVCAAGYLVLSGAGLATQRAFIMITIMFLAIILDRPALSMRNVALAALMILLVRPESVLSVSFQLSFVAVIALVAFYEFIQGRRTKGVRLGTDRSPLRRMVTSVGVYFWGVALTTLIAGAATGPVAAYHFNRVAVYGLLGNLLAVPLVGAIIMPLAILALVAMPFGLEYWPLYLMGEGIALVTGIAASVATLPGAVRAVTQIPLWAGLLVSLGLLWLCLWCNPWRSLGAGMILVAFVSMPISQRLPTVLVSSRANQVAVQADNGELVFSSKRAGKFAAERWLLKFGDLTPFEMTRNRRGFLCDGYGCTIALTEGGEVSVLRHPAILDEECTRAVVVITTFRVKGPCPSALVLLTPRELKRRGVHALWFKRSKSGRDVGEVVIRTAQQHFNKRPWRTNPEKIVPPKLSPKNRKSPSGDKQKKKAPVDQPVPPLQVRI